MFNEIAMAQPGALAWQGTVIGSQYGDLAKKA